ncbi:MAG: 4Fe-4S dicluster domain-containing protein [Desulfobacula sp.]|mgnify:FL=1|uniref:4Fe-4S dicluster domain-containing protein n=1 Tax=Desulfobacula sp. TaxID=2593537 RepID=UPI001DFBD85F|nr:4Fe-4S dicluster domain-containing protein [Desulfobacula sp.]MBT3804484.1 4Fe-4S dicluster domain-containing protein [Desulfobacula sp.]MBT4024922.1 4Fe-4S dicluster domain-containing protein [Desulfobacula sp.]MBT4198846.1 4Fe-4S dicluster domain-containing protein [Desulfobacula sp.]MBT4508062.1 4Fe-4S dicluster domain-containing protein [Desulfobacula sp.]
MKSKVPEKIELSRRTFLKCSGTIVFAMGGSGYLLSGCKVKDDETGMVVSDGYLVVDVQKCQGCISCMLACSLVHEGAESLSYSRIQILQDSFGKFPDDLTIEQCRQCEAPACVESCPEGALTANGEFGHVRMVDKEKCTGCGICFEACPYTPARLLLIEDGAFNNELKSLKCDLCANAHYHWDEKGGGPDGKQACVEVCPVGAIAFTRKLPAQEGTSGYKVNLRDKNWVKLGYRKS